MELTSISREWHSLAMVLKLETCQIEEIEQDYPNDVYKRKVEVITRWLKTGRGSWQALCDALRHELVQNIALAEKIERKYCTPP